VCARIEVIATAVRERKKERKKERKEERKEKRRKSDDVYNVHSLFSRRAPTSVRSHSGGISFTPLTRNDSPREESETARRVRHAFFRISGVFSARRFFRVDRDVR